MTNPDEIRKIADRRLKEAKYLLSEGFTEGAYYLVGYCVELYLKARICEVLALDDLFVDAETSSASRPSPANTQIGKLFKSHDLLKLLLLGGLSRKLEADKALDENLSANWSTVTSWKETKRYATIGSVLPEVVEELIEAIENPQNGIVPWIRNQ